MQRKSPLLLIIVVIALFTGMTYQSRKGMVAAPSPFSGILVSFASLLHNALDYAASPFERMALRERDVELLRKQNSELLLERARSSEALQENRRLKELLALRDRYPNAVCAAQVIARGTSQWKNSVVLNRGSADSVAKDMSAVTPQGLAGKLFDVSGSSSGLLLVSDITFSASIRMQESRKEGVVSGTGGPKLVLKYVPYEDEVKEGDILVTSGLDRLFPPGIPVGFISRIEKQGSGHFQEIEVTPYVDESRLEEVLVVR